MHLCIPGRHFQRVGAARTPVSKGASAGGESKLGVGVKADICCSSFSSKVIKSRPRSDLSCSSPGQAPPDVRVGVMPPAGACPPPHQPCECFK